MMRVDMLKVFEEQFVMNVDVGRDFSIRFFGKKKCQQGVCTMTVT